MNQSKIYPHFRSCYRIITSIANKKKDLMRYFSIFQRSIFSSVFLSSVWKEKSNELLLCSLFYYCVLTTWELYRVFIFHILQNIFFYFTATTAKETSDQKGQLFNSNREVLLWAITFPASTHGSWADRAKTYLVAKRCPRALHSKIQEIIQHPLGISFHERQGSRLPPKPRSFSCILVSLLDYFCLLGWTSTTGDKQAPSNPESIQIHHGDHGFEMGKMNLLQSSKNKPETWRKDWDILLVIHPQREYAPDLKLFQTGQWNHNHLFHNLCENILKKIN